MIILLVASVALIASITIYAGTEDKCADDPIKYNILADGSFSIAHDETGTYASGFYFKINDENDHHLIIVANISISPTDFGGVSFNFYSDAKIMHAYAGSKYDLSRPINIWSTAKTDGLTSFVEICRGNPDKPFGCWNGMVVIEVELPSCECNQFLIAAGSEIDDSGVAVIGPASQHIKVE